jgi:Flp pilus assembly protein TadG
VCALLTIKSLWGLNLDRGNVFSNAGSSGAPSRAQLEKLDLKKLERTGRSGRFARQRGNTILESALIFLPLMAFCFGIVDVSLAIFIQSTLTSAAREGTRLAITFPSSYNGSLCASQSTCIAQAVQYNAVGLPSGLASSYITVNYYTANDLGHPVEACIAASCSTAVCTVSDCQLPQTLSNSLVVRYANQPGNIVQVVVSGYPWNWLAPMPGFYAGKGVMLGASSLDVLGALAPGVAAPPNP